MSSRPPAVADREGGVGGQHRIGEQQQPPAGPHPVVEHDVFFRRERTRLGHDQRADAAQRRAPRCGQQAVDRLHPARRRQHRARPSAALRLASAGRRGRAVSRHRIGRLVNSADRALDGRACAGCREQRGKQDAASSQGRAAQAGLFGGGSKRPHWVRRGRRDHADSRRTDRSARTVPLTISAAGRRRAAFGLVLRARSMMMLARPTISSIAASPNMPICRRCTAWARSSPRRAEAYSAGAPRPCGACGCNCCSHRVPSSRSSEPGEDRKSFVAQPCSAL